MLHVDYIDNFETKALDVLRDLSPEAEGADIAVAFLSYRGRVELRPSLVGLVERGGRLGGPSRHPRRPGHAEQLRNPLHRVPQEDPNLRRVR
jgi:hypothetical protein